MGGRTSSREGSLDLTSPGGPRRDRNQKAKDNGGTRKRLSISTKKIGVARAIAHVGRKGARRKSRRSIRSSSDYSAVEVGGRGGSNGSRAGRMVDALPDSTKRPSAKTTRHPG